MAPKRKSTASPAPSASGSIKATPAFDVSRYADIVRLAAEARRANPSPSPAPRLQPSGAKSAPLGLPFPSVPAGATAIVPSGYAPGEAVVTVPSPAVVKKDKGKAKESKRAKVTQGGALSPAPAPLAPSPAALLPDDARQAKKQRRKKEKERSPAIPSTSTSIAPVLPPPQAPIAPPSTSDASDASAVAAEKLRKRQRKEAKKLKKRQQAEAAETQAAADNLAAQAAQAAEVARLALATAAAKKESEEAQEAKRSRKSEKEKQERKALRKQRKLELAAAAKAAKSVAPAHTANSVASTSTAPPTQQATSTIASRPVHNSKKRKRTDTSQSPPRHVAAGIPAALVFESAASSPQKRKKRKHHKADDVSTASKATLSAPAPVASTSRAQLLATPLPLPALNASSHLTTAQQASVARSVALIAAKLKNPPPPAFDADRDFSPIEEEVDELASSEVDELEDEPEVPARILIPVPSCRIDPLFALREALWSWGPPLPALTPPQLVAPAVAAAPAPPVPPPMAASAEPPATPASAPAPIIASTSTSVVTEAPSLTLPPTLPPATPAKAAVSAQNPTSPGPAAEIALNAAPHFSPQASTVASPSPKKRQVTPSSESNHSASASTSTGSDKGPSARPRPRQRLSQIEKKALRARQEKEEQLKASQVAAATVPEADEQEAAIPAAPIVPRVEIQEPSQSSTVNPELDELAGATQLHSQKEQEERAIGSGDVTESVIPETASEGEEAQGRREEGDGADDYDELEGATQLYGNPLSPPARSAHSVASSSAGIERALLTPSRRVSSSSNALTDSSEEDEAELALSLAEHASPVRRPVDLPPAFPNRNASPSTFTLPPLRHAFRLDTSKLAREVSTEQPSSPVSHDAAARASPSECNHLNLSPRGSPSRQVDDLPAVDGVLRPNSPSPTVDASSSVEEAVSHVENGTEVTIEAVVQEEQAVSESPPPSEQVTAVPRSSQLPIASSPAHAPIPGFDADSSSSSDDDDSEDSDDSDDDVPPVVIRGGRKSLGALTSEAFRRPMKPRASMPARLPSASAAASEDSQKAASELEAFLSQSSRPRLSASQLMEEEAGSVASSNFSSVAESREPTPVPEASGTKPRGLSTDDNEMEVEDAAGNTIPLDGSSGEVKASSPLPNLGDTSLVEVEPVPEASTPETADPASSPAPAAAAASSQGRWDLSTINEMPAGSAGEFNPLPLMSPEFPAVSDGAHPAESQYAPPLKTSAPLFNQDSQSQDPSSIGVASSSPARDAEEQEVVKASTSTQTAPLTNGAGEPAPSGIKIAVMSPAKSVAKPSTPPKSPLPAYASELLPPPTPTNGTRQSLRLRSASPQPQSQVEALPVASQGGRSSRATTPKVAAAPSRTSSRLSASQPSMTNADGHGHENGSAPATPKSISSRSARAASQPASSEKAVPEVVIPARRRTVRDGRASGMPSLSQLDAVTTPRRSRLSRNGTSSQPVSASQPVVASKSWVATGDGDDDNDEDSEEEGGKTRKAVW